MSIISEEPGGKASPAMQRTTIAQDPPTATQSTLRDHPDRRHFPNNIHTEIPPHDQQLPPRTQQIHTPSGLSPALPPPQSHPPSNGHAQHNMPFSSERDWREWKQFAQWASNTIEHSNRDIVRLGNCIVNIEKDLRNFNVLLNDMRNELQMRPTVRDITALRSEIQVLRESRNDVPSGIKGQKLSVDEFEVLTENMSRISEKANAVDDIKMQLDFLKSRTKRLEEVTRGAQSFPVTHPTPGSEPRNSPQTHVSPFLPSMNHGLPSTSMHAPLSGRDNLPNRVTPANLPTPVESHGASLVRKREPETTNILPSIPAAYQSDENEHQHKRFKYPNTSYVGEPSMTGKEYRALAAQPSIGVHEARTFVMTENGDFKPSHPGFVADPLTPKPAKSSPYRGGGRGRGGRGAGNVGREMGRVSQYSPPPQESVERATPYQSYEGMGVGTTGGDWLGSNPAVSAARTTEPFLETKSTRRNSEGVVLTKNGRPDGRSIKRRPILRNSDGIPVTRSGKPDGRFLAARSRKHEDQSSQSPVNSTGQDDHSEDSHMRGSTVPQEVATPTSDQLVVVEKEVTTNVGDVSPHEQLIPITPVLAPASIPLGTQNTGGD